MRLVLLAAAASALALVTLIGSPGSAVANKTKMGCDGTTEVWDAALGKCQPGTPKYRKRAVEAPKDVKAASTVKKTAKKEAGAKKAPAKAPKAK